MGIQPGCGMPKAQARIRENAPPHPFGDWPGAPCSAISVWHMTGKIMTTLYIAVLYYVRPLAEIEDILPAHRAWLKLGYADKVLLASGPREPRDGGVIILKGENADTVRRYLATDPLQSGGYASLELFPFHATMMADGLKSDIGPSPAAAQD